MKSTFAGLLTTLNKFHQNITNETTHLMSVTEYEIENKLVGTANHNIPT